MQELKPESTVDLGGSRGSIVRGSLEWQEDRQVCAEVEGPLLTLRRKNLLCGADRWNTSGPCAEEEVQIPLS